MDSGYVRIITQEMVSYKDSLNARFAEKEGKQPGEKTSNWASISQDGKEINIHMQHQPNQPRTMVSLGFTEGNHPNSYAKWKAFSEERKLVDSVKIDCSKVLAQLVQDGRIPEAVSAEISEFKGYKNPLVAMISDIRHDLRQYGDTENNYAKLVHDDKYGDKLEIHCRDKNAQLEYSEKQNGDSQLVFVKFGEDKSCKREVITSAEQLVALVENGSISAEAVQAVADNIPSLELSGLSVLAEQTVNVQPSASEQLRNLTEADITKTEEDITRDEFLAAGGKFEDFVEIDDPDHGDIPF